MNKVGVLNWLWRYRKILLLEALLLGILELFYFVPTWLIWWVLILIGLIVVFGWWIGNLKFNKATWLLVAEVLWAVVAGAGFLTFSLLSLVQVQLIIVLILILIWFIAYWHQNHIDSKQWNLIAVNWLGLIDILILFMATATLMLAVQFYSLNVFWLMLGVIVQLVLALYLLFWRQGLPNKKFWLYAVLLILISEQLVWITYAWHKNIYLKTFLFIIIYYLYSDFVAHYLRGNLTVKIVFEYLVIALFLILIPFLFDGLFMLIPNI